MEYSITCPCGRRIPVKASQAGTSIACECGAPVAVPVLSMLRELAGQDAYETGPVDVIRNMLHRGELPRIGRCAVSGVESKDVIEILVEAERIHPESNKWLYTFIGIAFSPIFLLGMFQKPRPDVGRETIVETPLCVDAASHSRIRRAGQRSLKQWLRTVPVYAQLLDAYPAARVKVRDVPPAPRKPAEGKAHDGSWLE
jgi:hypothetical protein